MNTSKKAPKTIAAALGLTLVVAGCQDDATQKNPSYSNNTAQQDAVISNVGATEPNDSHNFDALLQQLDDRVANTDTQPAQMIATSDGKLQIDWSVIDTASKQADMANFDYPFAAEGEPVQKYAQAFGVTANQAQHAMMISMASPEALGKIVDQLGSKYIAHSFRDGKRPALVIQTTKDVKSEQHSYVIADKFGEGLVLPIEIISGDKTQ